MKEYVSHGTPWLDFNKGEINIGEIFVVGGDRHRIEAVDMTPTVCSHCKGEGSVIPKDTHVMVHIDE